MFVLTKAGAVMHACACACNFLHAEIHTCALLSLNCVWSYFRCHFHYSVVVSICLQNSYLWKIDVSPPVYLFGTMHVPYTKLWQHIPDNAKVAFSSSHDLCVELRLTDSNTVDELAKCQRLPRGSKLDDVLSPGVKSRIANYLERIRQLLPNWLQVAGVPPLFGGGGTAYRYGMSCDTHTHMYRCMYDD